MHMNEWTCVYSHMLEDAIRDVVTRSGRNIAIRMNMEHPNGQQKAGTLGGVLFVSSGPVQQRIQNPGMGPPSHGKERICFAAHWLVQLLPQIRFQHVEHRTQVARPELLGSGGLLVVRV